MKSIILFLIGIIILVIVAWGVSTGWKFSNAGQKTSTPSQNRTSNSSSPNSTTSAIKNQMNVSINKSIFDPVEIKVPLGTTIIWTNRDSVPQALISDQDVFQSPLLKPGETFSYTFNQKGEYPYHEINNGEMKAKIQVENPS